MNINGCSAPIRNSTVSACMIVQELKEDDSDRRLQFCEAISTLFMRPQPTVSSWKFLALFSMEPLLDRHNWIFFSLIWFLPSLNGFQMEMNQIFARILILSIRCRATSFCWVSPRLLR